MQTSAHQGWHLCEIAWNGSPADPQTPEKNLKPLNCLLEYTVVFVQVISDFKPKSWV